MKLCRLIAPKWLADKGVRRVLEGEFSDKEIKEYNQQGYNIYYLPNHPSIYDRNTTLDGTCIDVYEFCFVDFDTKAGTYKSKEDFIEAVGTAGIPPTSIIDSGNGIHVYWKVKDLDAKSYLRLTRRLMRLFNTDEAVGQLFQLMRLPNTMNTKIQGMYVKCVQLYAQDIQYTCEELDKLLPPITIEDEAYCNQHYDRTFNLNQTEIDDELPAKFGEFIQKNQEAKELWSGAIDDRSKADYRLGHLMLAYGFTKDEAASVLVNTAKALQRAPVHRRSYANNIVDKIWTYEQDNSKGIKPSLSNSVKDILSRPIIGPRGARIKCWKYIDDTKHGFRMGHVMGLVAGSGVGKTSMALNIFMGFVVSNPDLEHFFCPLEETDRDIAGRWQAMCGDNIKLYEKVHVLSNYDDTGAFRDLSLQEIKEHILEFQNSTGKKVGCVVIDHIGVLCNDNKLGIEEGVKKISKAMKGFAEETQTFLIMQSQTARSKAGIGDLELDKDAAFGTSAFENFCDFLVTLWQPFKRVYELGAPTVMTYKFCKIRHKNQKHDTIKEDKRYSVFFDPETQLIRELIQDDGDLRFWAAQAASERKKDKNTEIFEYTSIKWEKDNENKKCDRTNIQ
jgi:KaiC/GvpD/RAD55 family RecA-like ATPase